MVVAIAMTLSIANGQDRCGTVEYTQAQKNLKNVIESTEQFEQWLQRKKNELRQKKGQRQKITTYQIPIVVHVIHGGENEGVGANIPDEQILSQISVLNKDYQRLNADAVNTPAVFATVAGTFDIEFVLAKQDPAGLATSGIVRMRGTKDQWLMADNYQLKSLSYWPAEDYLNIWVCNITDYLGYAQFPVSGLPGLENSSNNRLTDGVVIAYSSFGSDDDGPFEMDANYDKGRTATHEIGHFLGLRHIWGDDNAACGNNGDYVEDTPDQASNTSGCPTHPKTTCTPGVVSMFQNYMDYTYDRCMNLFTLDQVERMTTVLENSVRRASLLTSHGLTDPLPIANDAGIIQIVSPLANECSGQLTPTAEVKNYGSNALTSFTIRFRIGATIIETRNVTQNIAVGGSTVVDFPTQTITPGTATYSFEIINTNGTTDGNAANNIKSVQVTTPQGLSVPFAEPFNTLPASWVVKDLDNFISWELKTAPKDVPSNKAMYMNFYAYEDGEGELDQLVSPSIDLSTTSIAVLNFDVSHARFQGSNDGLRVYVLSGCNPNIFEGALVYEKTGSALETTDATNVDFTPTGPGDWRKESVSLQAFVGWQNIQIAFVGVNDWGNNLYIDNVAIRTDQLEDIALGEITPNFITCDAQPQLKAVVENVGTVTITSFKATVTIGGTPSVTIFNGLSIPPGGSTTVTLITPQLSTGSNDLVILLSNPNGVSDVNESNNIKEVRLALNAFKTQIPYLQDFEDFASSNWISLNPTGSMEWEEKSTPAFGTSMYFNAHANDEIGDKAWLISPVMDFSKADEAGVQFLTSYALNDAKEDVLQIFYSLDCGNTFEQLDLFEEKGSELSPLISSDAWTPEVAEDWQEKFQELNGLTGKDNLRFAFVVTNHHGNNLYLDNINFITSDEPAPPLEGKLFAVYDKSDDADFYVAFNLPETQNVWFEVVDMMGHQMVRGEISDVRYQEWPLSLKEGSSSGIYILRLGISGRFYSTKIYVSR